MPVVIGMRLTRWPLRLGALKQLATHVLQAVGEAEALLSLEIVGDVRMRRLNRTFRHRDKTTDVLAFATREGPGPPSSLLGDVVISLPQAIRQACGHEQGVDHELAVLLIHGILHLCGYDHERSDAEAQRMSRREKAVLRAVAPVPRLLVSRGSDQV
ncbi:MAG: rRNA maturation RNase YbeY [Nitrospira sp.]|jgi:probable rRNA maturation factor|uniref:rRNA maturation RNase YbeY n=1 Tax=Nitrospira sp. ND1 TaxID=1658518 RepID=UPI0009BAB00B|nr:rRNA maturation RNase YbeY [Nitrospira sp. ND1]MBK7484623.1 rRNA maturation RNase YbeY [Nitrospira sp.]MBK9995997.1 rRNA maturation RNase YbeY [Nitrospira sp.]MBP6198211.1 rRNA maturation RNase YbeY [Nitrospira sp.]MBP6204927.1 rRNA maturation RNase YbeY [Nitrospira sp.]MBP7360109.1 rRNA maturation RNase YbeY [Nitrospira sp.]